VPALAALALLAAAAPARAQLPPPLPGIIERVAPPEAPQLGPPLLPPEPGRATGPGEARRVPLGRVVLRGAAGLPEATLRAAAASLEGRQATLAEIEEARLAVLRLYRAAGYPYVAVGAALARGEDGRADLLLTITEGFIAELVLEGAAAQPVAQQVQRFLAPLQGVRPLPNAALERALLLAADIPGITARGVLRPIAGEPGALQLVVQIERRAISGFFSLDNRGYPLTGAWQGLLVGQLNSLTARGERTELALLQSEGNGQSFLQVTHEVFLGASGLRLRAYAGGGRSAPGAPLSAIGYRGDTRVAGAALIYPVLRSRPANLNISAQLDGFDSEVETRGGAEAPRERLSRDTVRALRFGIDGAMLDAWLGSAPAAATTTGLLRLHRGLSTLGAGSGDSGNVARAGSDFGFTRVVAEASRTQPLLVPAEGWLLSAFGIVGGQWSDDVLPPAEKFYLGGNRFGRGFYAGQLIGDRAVGFSAELQLSTTRQFAWPGAAPQAAPLQLGTQFYLFRDGGRVAQNTPDTPERWLGSWGGGVRFQLNETLQLDIEGVRRMTRTPEGVGVERLSADAVYARLLLRY
jgi:hemolysin activation/secretion protein